MAEMDFETASGEALERVRAYLDNAPDAGPWPLDADLHLLLAALDTAQRERDEAVAARDAEWRAAVEDVSERIGTNSPYVDAALDALLRAMEAP